MYEDIPLEGPARGIDQTTQTDPRSLARTILELDTAIAHLTHEIHDRKAAVHLQLASITTSHETVLAGRNERERAALAELELDRRAHETLLTIAGDEDQLAQLRAMRDYNTRLFRIYAPNQETH